VGVNGACHFAFTGITSPAAMLGVMIGLMILVQGYGSDKIN
jgi:hypothetical protein